MTTRDFELMAVRHLKLLADSLFEGAYSRSDTVTDRSSQVEEIIRQANKLNHLYYRTIFTEGGERIDVTPR